MVFPFLVFALVIIAVLQCSSRSHLRKGTEHEIPIASKPSVRLRFRGNENSVAKGGEPDGESEVQSQGQSRTAQRQVGRQTTRLEVIK